MQLAEEYLGIQLPQDLQQRVAEGHMTHAGGATVRARAHGPDALAESQRIRQTQVHDDAANAQPAQKQLANSVRDEVNTWEQATMAADPDYCAKKAAVQDTMWAVVREQGAPQSPDHAVKIAQGSISARERALSLMVASENDRHRDNRAAQAEPTAQRPNRRTLKEAVLKR